MTYYRVWTTAQIKAFADLADLHPGEPLGADSMANAGESGVILIWVADEPLYLLMVNGTIIDYEGGEVDAGVFI